ncbi:MAG: protein kinase domain-containing protein [Pseudonocardiaceae bacterium]
MITGVGSQVAGYRIDALVGRGGGGVVYRATHLRLGRTAALKLLAPELAADREFQRRFEREALMAGGLDHPHIVPVYDAGEAGGVLYLAMRLVEGPDLATVIGDSNGGLDVTRTCVILEQVASALDAAHASGLVHCDVKPGNILIDRIAEVGRVAHVYLSDFGLTRRSTGALSATIVAGTPSFMAPERFRGVPAAPAVDVYALGCVASACLIGSPPFEGDTIESVMAGHLYGVPPGICDRRADLPGQVDAVLAKALAKEPADRYPNCGGFVAALRDAVGGGAVAPPATPGPPAAGARPLSASPAALPTIISGTAPTHRRTMVGIGAVAAALVAALVVAVLVVAVLAFGWLPGSGNPSATATRLTGIVSSLAVDPAGGVYLDTAGAPRILKLEPSGTIRVVAGTGTEGYSGDGGPADQAQLDSPQGLAVDSAGNLYVADANAHRVRKIDPAGRITTVAGNGTQDSTGDGGPAALAQLYYPTGVAIDRSGNIYIAEGDRIRKIDQNGRISTVAGTGESGFSGDGGPATKAQLGDPVTVAVDDAGNLYIADRPNLRIRKVDAAGTITTVAGNGTPGDVGDGGPAIAAELNGPTGVAVDQAGNLYIADTFNDRIRKVDPGGRISTIAGNGIPGYSGDGGLATSAQLALPLALVIDRDGNIVIADSGNYRVRTVDHHGTITSTAGTGPDYPGDGGPATHAHLRGPYLAHVDKLGRLYIADSDNHRIRRVDPSGTITTIAGTGLPGYSGDGGDAINQKLNRPTSLLLDPAGNLYIADTDNHRVRKVTPEGKITTVAGTGRDSYSGDNTPAIEATLSSPDGLALSGDGSLYIADGNYDVIRRVDRAGIITTVAGNRTRGVDGDGGPATQAQLASPSQIQFDRAGNLYIADELNNRIRRVDPAGIITTIAGTGVRDFSGDGGPARDARLATPSAVAVDNTGNLYIADELNNRIRRVDPAGTITTIAGTGGRGFSGDGGRAIGAKLYSPAGVSVEADGAIYIADFAGNRIRKIDPAGIISTVAGPDAPDG